MKALTQSVLAAAMLVALPFAAAEACNKNAWNGNTSAATGAVAAGPANSPAQRRYSGSCSLGASAGQYVTDDTPSAEATYQASFYVFTGGNGKVFSATTANGGGGTEVVGVSYNGSQFTFSGPSGTTPIAAAPNAWYFVNVTHVSGGAFSARVIGNGSDTVGSSGGTSANATIESASLGFIGSGSGTFQVDEFNSVRSTTPVARLCKGDTNGDGVRNSVDGLRMRNESLGIPTIGQPDINENGVVNSQDGLIARNLSLTGQGACPAS